MITDLDGTLLPDNKILSAQDKAAIKRFRNDGGRFSIATGRTIQATRKFIQELEVDMPVILYNGSLIYDCQRKEILFTDELPPEAEEIAGELFDYMKNPGGEVLRLDNIYVVCNNEYEREHIKVCQVTAEYMPLNEVPKGGWYKILFATEPQLVTELENYVRTKNYPVDFVRSHDIFIEMLPKDSSKGAALKEYLKLMNLDGVRIVA
ncbi:MAG: HAD-IIB family hydrolase, partial [Porcipelethomonas sp.]